MTKFITIPVTILTALTAQSSLSQAAKVAKAKAFKESLKKNHPEVYKTTVEDVKETLQEKSALETDYLTTMKEYTEQNIITHPLFVQLKKFYFNKIYSLLEGVTTLLNISGHTLFFLLLTFYLITNNIITTTVYRFWFPKKKSNIPAEPLAPGYNQQPFTNVININVNRDFDKKTKDPLYDVDYELTSSTPRIRYNKQKNN